jgi:putative transposase
MAWGSTVDEEKLRFIAEWLKGELPMTVLCESFGVSRDTGYRLVRRYAAEGAAGLQPRSRAPHRPGRAMPEAIAAAIIAARQERPFWGPKKLRVLLARRAPETRWPAPSTIGELLRRAGLSEPRRRRRRAAPPTHPFGTVAAPNDLWCLDFKGWFRTRDGQRCDPLTVSDAASRYLLACTIVPPTTAGVAPVLERMMRDYGLPRAIRSDNGAPFAGLGAGGLTRLAVHWVKLGIRLERIRPGAPQQNGRHERMHRTLKRETTQPPAATPAEQQARFDVFRREYNEVRPHEALDQATPASRYHASPRPYPERLDEPWYDAEHAVRRVRPSGEIKWGGALVFVSEALAGEPVGIAETAHGDWLLRFADIELGIIDRRTGKLRRVAAGRPARRNAQPEQTKETVRNVSGLSCP